MVVSALPLEVVLSQKTHPVCTFSLPAQPQGHTWNTNLGHRAGSPWAPSGTQDRGAHLSPWPHKPAAGGHHTQGLFGDPDLYQLLCGESQEHKVLLLPSGQPCPEAWSSGLFPDPAVPYGSTGSSPRYCGAPHCAAAAEGAASLRADQFLLRCTPEKKAVGETSRSLACSFCCST